MGDSSIGLDETEMPDRPAPAARRSGPGNTAPGARRAIEGDASQPLAQVGEHRQPFEGPADEPDRLGPAQPSPGSGRGRSGDGRGRAGDEGRGRGDVGRGRADAAERSPRVETVPESPAGNGATPADEAHDRLVDNDRRNT